MFASDQGKGAWRCGVVALLLSLASSLSLAQSDKDAEQLKRLRLQMRQVQQQAQQAQANADQARQQAEASLKAQEGELQKHRGAASTASRRSAALAKELDALKPEHERTLAELAALKAQHEALVVASKAAQAQSTETEGSLRAQLAQLNAQMQRTSGDNLALAELGLELLQRYEDKGLGEVLSANEPFIQAGRVKLENLKASYQQRLDAARLKPTEAPR